MGKFTRKSHVVGKLTHLLRFIRRSQDIPLGNQGAKKCKILSQVSKFQPFGHDLPNPSPRKTLPHQNTHMAYTLHRMGERFAFL